MLVRACSNQGSFEYGVPVVNAFAQHATGGARNLLAELADLIEYDYVSGRWSGDASWNEGDCVR
jgi:hypothetical protein